MIKILTACTREVDELKTAVAELLEQLDLENRLRKNAVGLIAYHPEFSDSGLIEALCALLPFPTAGYTTPSVAVGGAFGDIMLTVAVLTSDDVEFCAGFSVPIAESPAEAARQLYSRIVPPEKERPALLLAFAPFGCASDDFITAIDAASGGIPLFGTLAFTHLKDFSGIETFANGTRGANALALVALFGEVNPRFYISDPPGDKEIRKRAIITRAEKNRILRINDFLAVDYLESIGLVESGIISAATSSFPFVLTLDDSSQIVRTAYKMTEEGNVILSGETPEGVEVGFSDPDANFVVQSAENMTTRILQDVNAENALIFSCVSRRWTLGAIPEREIKQIAKMIGDSLSYQFAYSGGEICPVINKEGRWINRFHNFTMAACLF
jgi:hypothetical protein